MFDRAEFPALLEQVVLGRYKFTGFGWVPYPRRVRRARPEERVPLPDQTYTTGYENLRRNRLRSRVVGWPVGGHNIIEVERHLRQFLTSDHGQRVAAQADAYIAAIQHNRANANAQMRTACGLFEAIWNAIEDRNPACPACLKRSRDRAARLARALRNLES